MPVQPISQLLQGVVMHYLREQDPEIYEYIVQEEQRQHEKIRLIASENYTSRAVMEATGSALTNKYSKGYHYEIGRVSCRERV